MTDEPDLTIRFDTASVGNPPRPDRVAQPGPRLYAPPHDHAELPEIPGDLIVALEQAVRLRRTVASRQQFNNDPVWARLAPRVQDLQQRLYRWLAIEPDNDEARAWLRDADALLSGK